MSDWEPVVILKTNVSVQDVYHGLGERGFTRCGRQLSVTSLPHWRWKYADAGWVRPCIRCFPDSNQDDTPASRYYGHDWPASNQDDAPAKEPS